MTCYVEATNFSQLFLQAYFDGNLHLHTPARWNQRQALSYSLTSIFGTSRPYVTRKVSSVFSRRQEQPLSLPPPPLLCSLYRLPCSSQAAFPRVIRPPSCALLPPQLLRETFTLLRFTSSPRVSSSFLFSLPFSRASLPFVPTLFCCNLFWSRHLLNTASSTRTAFPVPRFSPYVSRFYPQDTTRLCWPLPLFSAICDA